MVRMEYEKCKGFISSGQGAGLVADGVEMPFLGLWPWSVVRCRLKQPADCYSSIFDPPSLSLISDLGFRFP
jgi:hypothetical protein